jgi:hypothetical protein
MIQRLSLHSFPKIILFIFITCNHGKQKHAVKKGVNKNMVDERERDANGGRMVKNKI